MNAMRDHRDRLALLAAFLVPLGLAAVLGPFRGSFANTAAALLLVAVIVAVAVTGNRLTGVVASISAALWFDFFLTAPYERLAITHRNDIETTVCLLVVGIMVTELAARSRHHFHVANEESDFVAMINSLVDLAAGSVPTLMVVERAANSIRELLDLRACRFEADPPGPPLARIGSNGEVVHVGLLWPVLNIGIPGPEAEILTQWRGEVMGRFVLTPTPGLPVSVERRIVAMSLADLVEATLYEQRQVA